MHLLVIIIWLAWNTCNIEFSGFMAADGAVFFAVRVLGRCGLHCRVFGLGRGVAVLTVDGVKDGLFAARVELAVLAQEILLLGREGRSGWGSGGRLYCRSFLASPFL